MSSLQERLRDLPPERYARGAHAAADLAIRAAQLAGRDAPADALWLRSQSDKQLRTQQEQRLRDIAESREREEADKQAAAETEAKAQSISKRTHPDARHSVLSALADLSKEQGVTLAPTVAAAFDVHKNDFDSVIITVLGGAMEPSGLRPADPWSSEDMSAVAEVSRSEPPF
ncbi:MULTISPECIES: hypothetical protein [unclassified Rhodococcus (in: high G+C Gram-positive bacteria)]|uniref:hypothetical protein n=1 Tax=unclassified Rhodococcus (in: high G+C Gram-positive bacteria) TaxID=192944 RepID=UPI003395CEB6